MPTGQTSSPDDGWADTNDQIAQSQAIGAAKVKAASDLRASQAAAAAQAAQNSATEAAAQAAAQRSDAARQQVADAASASQKNMQAQINALNATVAAHQAAAAKAQATAAARAKTIATAGKGQKVVSGAAGKNYSIAKGLDSQSSSALRVARANGYNLGAANYSKTYNSNPNLSAARNKAMMLATSYIGASYKLGGESHQTIDCIVQGTLIATDRGEVPIEAVRAGDRVLTRRGYRRVLDAWKVRDDAELATITVGNRALEGTPDHRVWTENRGWVPLGRVTSIDTVVWCQANESSSTAARTTATRNRLDQVFARISSVVGRMLARCTGRSGSTTTGRFRSTTRYTTSTTTPSTTTSRTSRSYLSPITGGRVPMLVGSTATPAQSAASSSSPLPTGPRPADFALSSASGSGSTVRRGSVYDISVEGEHEFFANGVLVHNCSGLIQAVYTQLGFKVPTHSAADQGQTGGRSNGNGLPGQRVGWGSSKLQPGDIIAWKDGSHIAVYAGAGKIIEAANERVGTVERPLWANPSAVVGIHLSL